MKEKILFFGVKHPLSLILFLAIMLRILVAVFSQSYNAEFTHANTLDKEYFYYVEVPNAWISRAETPSYSNPQGISLTYLYINYLFFGLFRLLGIHNMYWLLLATRIINSLISLLIITLGYRITKIISNKTTALIVASILAFFWIFAVLSVNTMPQIASIPCLLYGSLLIIKQDYLLKINKIDKVHRTTFFIAGIFLGLGFALWYQSIFYFLGIVAALLIIRSRKGALMTVLGFLLMLLVTQTIPDQIVWKQIFAEMRAFFINIFTNDSLNARNSTFILKNILLFLPIFATMLFGFCKNMRKNLLLTLPTLLYVLFCVVTPYQNYSLTAVIPMFSIVGFAGWHQFYKNSAFWARKYWCWMLPIIYFFAFVINIALIILTICF